MINQLVQRYGYCPKCPEKLIPDGKLALEDPRVLVAVHCSKPELEVIPPHGYPLIVQCPECDFKLPYSAFNSHYGGINKVFVDVETTGLNSSRDNDEIVSISILAHDGTILLDTLVNPCKTEWPEAQKIHGISPADVKDAPPLHEIAHQIINHIKGKHIISYNASFDMGFLEHAYQWSKRTSPADRPMKISCAMQVFAILYDDIHPYYGTPKWQKLSTALSCLNYEPRDAFGEVTTLTPHTSLDDAVACRAVWNFCEFFSVWKQTFSFNHDSTCDYDNPRKGSQFLEDLNVNHSKHQIASYGLRSATIGGLEFDHLVAEWQVIPKKHLQQWGKSPVEFEICLELRESHNVYEGWTS